MEVKILHPRGAELLGFIPEFLRESDPRTAAEQFHERYAHGGGWSPFQGFKLLENRSIKYPGDPAHKPVAELKFRDETILVYEHAWVCILQTDGKYEISRMD